MPNRLLVVPTLGLLGGLFMALVGRDIMDAIHSGTYNSVLGLEIITGLVNTIGAVIAIISLLCMIGVIVVVRHK